MQIPFIDLQAQYQAYKDEIDSAIHDILDTSRYIMGPALTDFEADLKTYTGAKHAIGCSSGTSAIELSLRALGIGPGDEVITSPFTFFATAEMISIVGAVPVFVDIEPDTYNIDANLIEAAITEKTKAIMPVSIFGQCADMDAIKAIAAKHNLPVIEDAAQSFGAEYKGTKSCALSEFATTSFFPAKPLGGYGDAGAVFCEDDTHAAKLRSILNHGQGERYKHDHIGINGRLDAMQAAILRVKLKYFTDECRSRHTVAQRYTDALASIVSTPTIKENRTSVYAQYSIQVEDREAFCAQLKDAGVPTAVHYPIPVYAQNAYQVHGYNPASFPVTEKVCAHIVSLPFSPFLKEEDQDHIISTIQKVFA